METDAGIKPTRDARRRISTSVDDDPAKMMEHYVEMQKRFGARLRRGPSDGPEDIEDAAEQSPAAVARTDARG
jgi:hypothetical protein